LPHALKGVDLVVYNVFTALGLSVKIRPLLDVSEELDWMDEMNYEFDVETYGECPEAFLTDWSWEDSDSECGCCGEPQPPFFSFEEWKLGKPHGDLVGYKFDPLKFCQSDEESTFLRQYKEEVRMPRIRSSASADSWCSKYLEKTWKFKRYYNIKWLNKPRDRSMGGPWELALQNLPWADVDEPTTEEFYSHVVLLVKVPKMAERNLKPKE
jgi:hypothetical protein